MIKSFLVYVCASCLGFFEHPLSFPEYKTGWTSPQFRDWKRLLEAADIPNRELRYVKGLAWREDRWRNRRHRHPLVAGLFGQKGNPHPCPLRQVTWANKYALKRYGSWRKALLAHRRKGWW